MLGLSSNSPDEFTAGHAQVLKPLAVAGACVIAIDHLPKNTENKANGQTGTAASVEEYDAYLAEVQRQMTKAAGQL